MKCKFCNNHFCFVCLSVPKNGVWACGGSYDYCGKVGGRQKLAWQNDDVLFLKF